MTTAGSPLSSDESRWILAADECLRLYDVPKANVVVTQVDNDCFRACYPIARHALNQVAAGLALIRTGSVYPAAANGRVALEHALVAQWVLLTDQGEKAFVAATRRSNAAFVADLARYADVPEALLTQPENTKFEGASYPGIQAICDRFDGKSRMIYTIYRSLSGAVHPSAATLVQHLETDPRTENLRLLPYGSAKLPTDLAMSLGWSAVMAAFVLESLTNNGSRVNEVDMIARRGRLPMDLKSADTQPQLQRAAVHGQ